MGFENLLKSESREALEAMCKDCLNALVDSGRIVLPAEPLGEFTGTPGHVLVDEAVPLCKLYWNPDVVTRRNANRKKMVN